jgi:hypothetical protein
LLLLRNFKSGQEDYSYAFLNIELHSLPIFYTVLQRNESLAL